MARLSCGALADLVEAYTAQAAVGAALVHVQAGYDRVLEGLDPVSGVVHFWSFLQPLAELSLAATVSGTATGVYDAVADTTTITATTSIFCPSHVGETITVTTVGELVIASYTSPTVLVATAGEDFAGKAVSLPHSGKYALPAGFGGLIELPTYPYAAGLAAPRFEETSVERIFERWRDVQPASTPSRYALMCEAQAEAQTAQTWSILVDPRPEATRTVWYRYAVTPAVLTDSDTVYPLGPAEMSRVYQCAAMAAAELAVNRARGIHEVEFQRAMHAAIVRDGALLTTHDSAELEA